MSEWDSKSWLVLGVLIGGLAGFIMFSNYNASENYSGSEISGYVLLPVDDSSCIKPVYPGSRMTVPQLKNYFAQGIAKFIITQLPPGKNTYATRSLIISSVQGAVDAQSDATIKSWVKTTENGNCDVVDKYLSSMNPWNLVRS